MIDSISVLWCCFLVGKGTQIDRWWAGCAKRILHPSQLGQTKGKWSKEGKCKRLQGLERCTVPLPKVEEAKIKVLGLINRVLEHHLAHSTQLSTLWFDYLKAWKIRNAVLHIVCTHIWFGIIYSKVEIIEIGRKNKSEATSKWLKEKEMVL